MTYSILFSSHRLLKVLEAAAVVLLLLAVLYPSFGARWFGTLERRLKLIAQCRWKAVLLAAGFPLVVRFLMLAWYPPPPPQIHDEFSYLLQADTFAHGRVANPTPPFWEHFETEYTLLTPTYASQYQPAQGLVLAAGQVLLRHPWWGVFFSVGVMCGALCWALGFALPPAWALAGALGAGLQFGIFGLWMNSYFGGAVSATAGAMVFAAIMRMRRPGLVASASALAAAGIILLFATRPFEALLWIGVFAASVLWQRRSAAGLMLRSVAPAFMVVFLAGACALAWYNWRITGKPLVPPYLEYRNAYGTPQPYWWQGAIRVSNFRHEELKNNYKNQERLYDMRADPVAVVKAEKTRLAHFWRFFIGPFLSPALAFILFLRRDKRLRFWLLACIPFILDKVTYHAWYPAHSGPATILIVLVLVQCWRHMRVWQRERGTGLAMSRLMVAGLCLAIVFGNAGRAAEPLLPEARRAHLAPLWESLYPAKRLRDDVIARLERIPGSHLVFVKYAPGHCFCEEWVFNGADIRNQRIVFARVYTNESNVALANYLNKQNTWIIEPDLQPYMLARLDASNLAALTEREQARAAAQ
ncbi:MAG: hypothetical protein JWN34_4376 [Bryobacterales bacterium]|nr:hypothetical protein [Bryobacterales bacterium]